MSSNPFDDERSGTVVTQRARGLPAHGLRITVTHGDDAGVSSAIAQRRAIIGRAAGADFRLSDPMVSAFHVELTATESGVLVQDLASRNGTLFAARTNRACSRTLGLDARDRCFLGTRRTRHHLRVPA